MSFRKTLVLALILCGVFYYILSVEIPAQKEEARKELAFKNFDKAKVAAVEIIKPDGSFALENAEPAKQNGKWQLAGLPGAFLDTSTVNSLLTALSELKLDSTLPKEDLDSDLTVYGLKEPALSIKVKGDNETVIQIGKKNDYLGKYYLKLSNDENIYLIPDSLYSASNKKVEDFRDKSPVEFIDTELKSITLKNSGQIIKLDRSSAGDWALLQPLSARASSQAVSEFARSLRNLSAVKFIDKPAKLDEYKLESSGLSVSLEYPDNKKPALEIQFGKVVNDKINKFYFFLKDGPTVYEVQADPFTLLAKVPDDFRDKNVFSFATDLVKAAEAEGGGLSKISLVKDKNEWKVNGKAGDKVFIDQWLSNLSALQAHSFPSGVMDYGFEKPKFKVSIDIGEGKKNLVIGNDVKEGEAGTKLLFAVSDDLSNPFIINEDTYKKLTVREEALLVTEPGTTAQGEAAPEATLVKP